MLFVTKAFPCKAHVLGKFKTSTAVYILPEKGIDSMIRVSQRRDKMALDTGR